VRVFLLHGLGRTSASMAVLAHRLKKAGHRPTLFGYQVLLRTLDDIAGRFAEKADRVLDRDRARARSAVVPYAVVSHSLGNVITRLASPRLPDRLDRFVMIAPPNRVPAIATALENNPIFRAASKDAGRKLTDEEFFARLPKPEVPTLVIAGTKGPSASWLPFSGEPNDGIVKVDETRYEGASQLLIHGVHTFLMNRRDVFDAVERFLTPDARSEDP
jgi:pimeloyl-ACP methyl ester carboxylesterase